MNPNGNFRLTPPTVRPLDKVNVTYPERRHLKNGIPLNIIQAGMEEVVRFDLLMYDETILKPNDMMRDYVQESIQELH